MYKKILKNQAEEAQAKKAGNLPAADASGSSGSSTAIVKN
jgi:chromodomain-helicase-DNA-binding protein 1